MARPMNPKRMKALKIWLNSGRRKKPKEIAEELGTTAVQIRQWKYLDKWDDIPIHEGPKRGAPYRNKNAVGNKGGSAPLGNENALKHGLFKKWLPNDPEYQEIYEAARSGMSMLEILHEQIAMSFTNIIRSQNIMFVKDRDDMDKELKKLRTESVNTKDGVVQIPIEKEYEIQFAHDKQAKLLTSQAAAMRALSNKIKQYEDMIRTLPPEEVKEEQRLHVQKIKADIQAVESKVW